MTRKESFRLKAKREEELATKYFDYKRTQGKSYGLVFSTDQFSAYDVKLMKDGKQVAMVEVKVRDQYTYKQVQRWGGSFFELKKLTHILKQQREENIDLPLIYLNFYKDCVMVYELSKEIQDYNWIEANLQENDYSKRAEKKFVTMLTSKYIVETINRSQEDELSK